MQEFEIVQGPKTPFTKVTKRDLGKMPSAFWKATLTRKGNKDVVREVEFCCFVSPEYSFWMTIQGDSGMAKTHGKAIEDIKRSISAVR